MVYKSSLTVLLFASLLAAGTYALAHGDPVKVGDVSEAALIYGNGAQLVPLKIVGDGNTTIAWMKAVGKDGSVDGFAGVINESTGHGRISQATCLDLEGNILGVVVLKVMGDEREIVKKLIGQPVWWEAGLNQSLEGAAMVLLKSVYKVKSGFGALELN